MAAFRGSGSRIGAPATGRGVLLRGRPVPVAAFPPADGAGYPAEMAKIPIWPLLMVAGSVMLATVLEPSIGIDWENM
jgi:hypothetical protein